MKRLKNWLDRRRGDRERRRLFRALEAADRALNRDRPSRRVIEPAFVTQALRRTS